MKFTMLDEKRKSHSIYLVFSSVKINLVIRWLRSIDDIYRIDKHINRILFIFEEERKKRALSNLKEMSLLSKRFFFFLNDETYYSSKYINYKIYPRIIDDSCYNKREEE